MTNNLDKVLIEATSFYKNKILPSGLKEHRERRVVLKVLEEKRKKLQADCQDLDLSPYNAHDLELHNVVLTVACALMNPHESSAFISSWLYIFVIKYKNILPHWVHMGKYQTLCILLNVFEFDLCMRRCMKRFKYGT
jgi:hypothetical protein